MKTTRNGMASLHTSKLRASERLRHRAVTTGQATCAGRSASSDLDH